MEQGRPLTLINSTGVYAAWHNAETQKVTVQFSRGLAKYRYSNFTEAKAADMEAITSHVGQWFRAEVILHPELYPCEKLD